METRLFFFLFILNTDGGGGGWGRPFESRLVKWIINVALFTIYNIPEGSGGRREDFMRFCRFLCLTPFRPRIHEFFIFIRLWKKVVYEKVLVGGMAKPRGGLWSYWSTVPWTPLIKFSFLISMRKRNRRNWIMDHLESSRCDVLKEEKSFYFRKPGLHALTF